MEEVLTQRNGRQRAVARLQIAGGRQNRHDERLQRRVVRWLHQHADLRRVGRIRSTDNNYFTRLRRRARAAGLDTGNEQSGTTLSSRAVATDHADPTRHSLFAFESTRHDGLHVGRDSLRHRSARRQGANRRCQVHGGEQWPFAQQFQGLPQKAATFPGRCLQIVSETFRRKMTLPSCIGMGPLVTVLVSSIT